MSGRKKRNEDMRENARCENVHAVARRNKNLNEGHGHEKYFY